MARTLVTYGNRTANVDVSSTKVKDNEIFLDKAILHKSFLLEVC